MRNLREGREGSHYRKTVLSDVAYGMFEKTIMGIDLAGSEKRDSGIAVLSGMEFLFIGIVHSDDEVMGIAARFMPSLIAIDAPLTLPIGRKSIDERSDVHFRECDLQLRKRGIRFFPITIGPMRMLTKRGMGLKDKLGKRNIKAIEVFPGASYDMLGIKRKEKKEIVEEFTRGGYKFEKRDYTQDELDGMMCAITGNMVVGGGATALGGEDGTIYIPHRRAKLL